jgi:hypothetical protein
LFSISGILGHDESFAQMHPSPKKRSGKSQGDHQTNNQRKSTSYASKTPSLDEIKAFCKLKKKNLKSQTINEDCSPSPECLDMMNLLRKSIQAPREEVDNLKRTIKQTIDEIKAFCESKKQKKINLKSQTINDDPNLMFQNYLHS